MGSAGAAGDVGDRTRGARCRNRVVDAELMRGNPQFDRLLRCPSTVSRPRRAFIRPGGGALPQDRRLAHHFRGATSRSRSGTSSSATVSPDHSEGLWRQGLRHRQFRDRAEDRPARALGGGGGDRAELARAGRAPDAVRHRGAEEILLPRWPTDGRSRPSRSPARCRIDAASMTDRGVVAWGEVDGKRTWHARQLDQALYLARADLHGARPRLPAFDPDHSSAIRRISASPWRWCRRGPPASRSDGGIIKPAGLSQRAQFRP